MPQESVGYAVGRISMLRRDALDASRLERLLSTASYAEAKRTLSEIGWTAAEETDYEQLAMERVANASRIVRQLSTDEKVTDCFLLKYDIANLKMLLKARCLGISADYLSESGTMAVDALRHAVTDHNYKFLPAPIAQAMDELEKELVIHVDPMVIDVKLDQAMFRRIFLNLKKTKCRTAVTYFQARVDLLNALTMLRAQHMKKDSAFFMAVLLEGGTITEKEWQKAYAESEELPKLLAKYGVSVQDAAYRAVADFARLPGLEKAMDNELLKLFLPYKYDNMNLEFILSYLLATEREAAAVRLVMAGKANGFAMEAIRERLRDLYG